MATKASEVKQLAEDDLYAFAVLVNPSYEYGEIHRKVFRWLQHSGANGLRDLLLLLPRGHLKSHMIAVWCAWWITKFPEVEILYVSATEDLAMQQLAAIKNILTCAAYRRYWPEMVNAEEAKREEWNLHNIKIDHPDRKKHGVVNRTVAARSVGSNTTGLHADVLVFDDLVVPSNAYTEAGRDAVAAAYSQFSSVANPGAISRVCGTRYHGKDIYNQMLETEVEIFNEVGEIVGTEKMYEVLQEVVESDGAFLWPRSMNVKTGKWFGFNQSELAKIRAKYFASRERAQYYAQYYNDPNPTEGDESLSTRFQYWDQHHLKKTDEGWTYSGRLLNLFAGGDLAYTEGVASDYTAYAVVGLDHLNNVYILDLFQFKTQKYERMYKEIERLHDKWGFRKLRMETNAGANLVVEYLKTRFREEGRLCSIEGKKSVGEKNERCGIILNPRYEALSMYHPAGGYTTTYEEQITLSRPAHDDLRDAVAAAVEISVAPKRFRAGDDERGNVVSINSRFGGRVR